VKIWDCFIIDDELDLLDLRLGALAGVVDRFVIVEGTTTFQGDPKPLYFRDSAERFSSFLNRIVHVIVTDYPQTYNPWIREYHQRDAIRRGLGQCDPTDIVLLSDVDEIPSPHAVLSAARRREPLAFEQHMYYYYLNMKCVSSPLWYGTRAFPIGRLTRPSADRLRQPRQLPNAGWHFSYLGGPDAIVRKLNRFSHAEYNQKPFTDRDRVARCLVDGIDLFGRPLAYSIVPLDATFPAFLLAHRDRYAHLIAPHGAPQVDRSTTP
jgi:hypothetical protein